MPSYNLPLVSIIMTTYNRARLIGETIQSIREQTYANWELIIIDDGSTDETETVVKCFGDERIQFYKAGRQGIGGLLKNIGIQKTKGGLIAFIDSDDLWHKTKIQQQVDVMEQYPGAGFCITGGYNFAEAGKPTEYFYKQTEGLRYDNLFLSFFRSEIACFTQALLVRKECISTAGSFREVKSFSDLDFILSVARYFEGIILYEPLLYRRIHAGNYINTTWEKSYEEGINLLISYRDDPLLPVAIWKESLFRTYINFGEKYIGYNQRSKALGKFILACRYKPFSIIPLKKIIKLLLSYRGRT